MTLTTCKGVVTADKDNYIALFCCSNSIFDCAAFVLFVADFNEVVLTDFCFPDSDQYIFNGDKDVALEECAAALAKEVLTEKFTLSFAVKNPAFKLPEGRTRLYLENVAATQVGATASQVTVAEPDAQVVFITATNDTRYSEYGALRPIASSTVLEAQKANAQKQQQQANAQASADAASKSTEPTADAAGRFG